MFRKTAVRYRLLAVGAAALLVPFLLQTCAPTAVTGPREEPAAVADAGESAGELGYRNAVSGPPPGWTGPVFELSDDYPTADPGACPPETCPWLALDVDFSQTSPPVWGPPWSDYLQSIFDYVKQGQDLSPEGWNVAVDGETRWYHVPWMAYDPKVGREFVHGFTNERTAYLSDFLGYEEAGDDDDFGVHTLPLPGGGTTQEGFESWAVGFYNPWGGYAIGRTWSEDGKPLMTGDPQLPAGLPFPEGTVVAKILFTAASPQQVPYLAGSPEWTADRHVEVGGCVRAPQPMYLVQMDVAVVDERSPTRWVYGTFVYDGTLPAGSSPWDRVVPLGLQWGSDPETFPAVPQSASQPVHESVLAPIDIYEHFGCGGRLAGPVDNKLSSCLSCHGGGYVAQPAGSISEMAPPCEPNDPSCNHVPQIFGFDGLCTEFSEANHDYFANVVYPEQYTGGGYPDTFSTDTSLQLQVAFMQFGVFNTNGEPDACTPSTPG